MAALSPEGMQPRAVLAGYPLGQPGGLWQSVSPNGLNKTGAAVSAGGQVGSATPPCSARISSRVLCAGVSLGMGSPSGGTPERAMSGEWDPQAG